MSLGVIAVPARGATPVTTATPELIYTINHPAELKAVEYGVSGDRVSLGTPRVIAQLPAADGLALLSEHEALVGGGSTGMVFKVDLDTGKVTSAPSGIPTAYHVTLSRDKTFAWTAGLPGQLAKIPLDPFGAGSVVAVHGDDLAVTTIGLGPNGAFYTTSDSHGSGDFGTLDLATMTTHRTIANLRGAHGFSYDPYTSDVLLFGAYQIDQIDPAQPDSVLAQEDFSPPQEFAFDQGVVDGQGHLLVGSNTGYLVFVDYAATSRVGKTSTTSRAFLDTNLDDLAVLHPAAVASAAPASSSSSKKKIVTLVVLIVGVGGIGFLGLRMRQGRSGR